MHRQIFGIYFDFYQSQISWTCQFIARISNICTHYHLHLYYHHRHRNHDLLVHQIFTVFKKLIKCYGKMSYLQIRRSTVYAYILQKIKIQSTWIITNYVGLKTPGEINSSFFHRNLIIIHWCFVMSSLDIYNPLYFWLRSHVYSRYGHLFDKWLIG